MVSCYTYLLRDRTHLVWEADMPKKPAVADALSPLPEYFSAQEDGDKLLLRCLKCQKGYKLPKGSMHPGNRITLMNHVRTHSDLEEL